MIFPEGSHALNSQKMSSIAVTRIVHIPLKASSKRTRINCSPVSSSSIILLINILVGQNIKEYSRHSSNRGKIEYTISPVGEVNSTITLQGAFCHISRKKFLSASPTLSSKVSVFRSGLKVPL